MKSQIVVALTLGLVLLAAGAPARGADGDLDRRVNRLESEVRRHGAEIEEIGTALVLIGILYGTVFAIWAQNRARSGFGWFLCGLPPGLNVIAAFVLLYINAMMNRVEREEGGGRGRA